MHWIFMDVSLNCGPLAMLTTVCEWLPVPNKWSNVTDLYLVFPYILILCMLFIIIRSQAICQFLYRYPIFIDATAAVAEKKGDRFLARWADIMTGRIHKANLLRPEFSLTVGFQALLLFYKKMFKGGYGKKSKLL